jgi:hypothetical protein
MVLEGPENLYHELTAADVVFRDVRRYLLAHLTAQHEEAAKFAQQKSPA